MPSNYLFDDDRIPRRGVLAGLGTAVTSSLAGCGSQFPGVGAEQLDVETTVEHDQYPRILWKYPPREGDTEGIGYASVEVDRVIQRDASSPAIKLKFNSTIGRLASDEPYRGYHPDWFRFRVWPPTTYEGRLQYRLFVEPPGQWEQFSAYYEIQGNTRRTTIELQNVDTQGTIVIPAVFDPEGNSLPSRLHCSFTVRASWSGLLGKSVRVSEKETLPLTEQ